ncbi:winged helix-turn-helix domain-containing protein [Dissulfuribacter thermophilus]|nr:response regulator transcription factor [Dissulfuribacter thermophilus]
MDRPKRILIVEDDPEIANIEQFNLDAAGFDTKAIAYGGGIFHEIRNFAPDLIILDIMLPDVDGFEIIKALKERNDTRSIPVIMVTAKDAQDDRIYGLELGADDYVVKPFSPRELVLRARAVLKRAGAGDYIENPQNIIEKGILRIDKAGVKVTVAQKEIELTRVEFKLLTYLAEHPSIVLTRQMLMEQVWGYNYPVNSRTVDTHIRRLRKKLGQAADYIETVRGIGYKFKI